MGKNSSKDLSDIFSQEFFDLKSTTFKRVYTEYSRCVIQKLSQKETEQHLASFLYAVYGFESQTVAPLLAHHLYERFSSVSPSSAFIDPPPSPSSALTTPQKEGTPVSSTPPAFEPQIMQITLLDYQKYIERIQLDTQITMQLKSLLLSFIVFYRRNFHPTGWVRYDKKNILFLAGLSKLSAAHQEKLTSYLHDNYGLNMQVVGSNQPIPCYKIDWLYDQPTPGSTDNPFISLGYFDPKDLQKVITQITDNNS